MRTDDEIKQAWVHATMPLDDMIAVLTFLDYAFETMRIRNFAQHKLDELKHEYQTTGVLSERLKAFLMKTAKEYQADIVFTADEVKCLCETRKVAWE